MARMISGFDGFDIDVFFSIELSITIIIVTCATLFNLNKMFMDATNDN